MYPYHTNGSPPLLYWWYPVLLLGLFFGGAAALGLSIVPLWWQWHPIMHHLEV